MRKAVLIVGFGTSYADAEESCILPVERSVAEAFSDREPFRAWTSRIIAKKLLRTRGVAVENEEEALSRLHSEGVEDILVVSTHLIPGIEYDLVREKAGPQPVSRPLLDTEEDLRWMADVLASIAGEEGRPLLLMGHGTEHSADGTYPRLRALLPENVFLACVEGAHSLEEQLPRLEALDKKELTLMPLMLVAGDHARNDLAGDGDSWKTRLEALGFDVRVRMQGLGALSQVQQRFADKARQASL